MANIDNSVIELKDVAIYHNINPYTELTEKNYLEAGERVLESVNLTVKRGELIYLIGRVGSGKSTLLKTLYGEISLFEGEGIVAGVDLRTLKRKQLPELRRKLGIVFQDLQVLSDCNVYENLAFVLRATDWDDENLIKSRIEEVLKQVGLENYQHKMPFEMSGGECQRLMIARALLNSPELILADEPTGNLDPLTAESIIALFHNIAKAGTAVIISTHNTILAEEYPARTLRFYKKHIEEVDLSAEE